MKRMLEKGVMEMKDGLMSDGFCSKWVILR